MKTKLPLLVMVFLFLAFLFGIGSAAFIAPDPDYVISERRKATALPRASAENFADGSLAKDFEQYLLDSLPMRDSLRLLKNRFSQTVLGLSDVDGCFLTENGVAKDLSPVNEATAKKTAATFDRIVSKYFPENRRVFLSVIPDKAYYARPEGERLDCDALTALLDGTMQSDHTYVDLKGALSLASYYATDIHWKEEALFAPAACLGDAMDFSVPDPALFEKTVLGSFVGTLGAQAALSDDRDTLALLYDQTGVIADAEVHYPDGVTAGLYDTALFDESYDKYDVFLRGETVGDEASRVGNFFVTIRNTHAKEERKLILFRDSFARSLLPLLVFSYSEIVVVDLRAPTAFYGENEALLTADDSTDVLFLISTHTLNSTEIR